MAFWRGLACKAQGNGGKRDRGDTGVASNAPPKPYHPWLTSVVPFGTKCERLSHLRPINTACITARARVVHMEINDFCVGKQALNQLIDLTTISHLGNHEHVNIVISPDRKQPSWHAKHIRKFVCSRIGFSG